MRQTTALGGMAFWERWEAGRGPIVELGELRLPRESIVSCRIEDVVEHDAAGKIATIALLFAAALVVLLGLLDFGWAGRLTILALVLGVIGAVSALEAMGLTRKAYYRLDILLNDGRRVGYTTPNRKDAEALAAELG